MFLRNGAAFGASLVGLNVLAAIWRIAGAIDAYTIARSPNSDDDAAVAIAVGGALLGAFILLPHLAVGRYTYDTITLVETVFVVVVPDDCACHTDGN